MCKGVARVLLGDKYIVENIQFCRAVLGQC